MKWGQVARHTAVAIGITFVVVAGFYLMVRILLFALKTTFPNSPPFYRWNGCAVSSLLRHK